MDQAKGWWFICSCFGAIYRMQKLLAGTLSNTVAKKAEVTCKGRCNCLKQESQCTLMCLCRTVFRYSKTIISIANRNIFKVSHRRLRKGENLGKGKFSSTLTLKRLEWRQVTYGVLKFFVLTWNIINTFGTSHWCSSKIVVPKFEKH